MLGCGICSAAATSDAAYVACWRSISPAIAKASSAGAKATLVGLGDDQPDAPCLRALAAAALRVAALLPADDRPLVALDDFCSKPTPGLQRKITHASEAATSDSATALRPSDTMRAGNRELWVDLTVVCPLLISYISTARHTTGAAAAAAAACKRNKYINDIPGFAFFMPLPFDTE